MPGQIIILDEEYAAEAGYNGFHVFAYLRDENGSVVPNTDAGSVVLSHAAVFKLAGITDFQRQRDEAEATP